MDKSIGKKYKIADSLEYGLVLSTGRMALFYGTLIFLFLSIIVMIIIAIIEPESIPYVIILSCVFSLGIAANSFLLITHHKIRSKIKLWLQDSVHLTAISNAVGAYKYNQGGFIPTTSTKLMLTFKYNGKQIIKYSGRELPGGSPQSSKYGYSRAFTKYANKEIPILYSPKYDQVLLLKVTRKTQDG